MAFINVNTRRGATVADELGIAELSTRSAIGLLEVFLISMVIALGITIASVSAEVQVLASALVSPTIILTVVFIYCCRKGRIEDHAGASVLGAIGGLGVNLNGRVLTVSLTIKLH